MPFLWLSSSSSVIIGRNTSCSSKRNSDIGSCISTLVSSTKSLAGPVPLRRCAGLGRVRPGAWPQGRRAGPVAARARRRQHATGAARSARPAQQFQRLGARSAGRGRFRRRASPGGGGLGFEVGGDEQGGAGGGLGAGAWWMAAFESKKPHSGRAVGFAVGKRGGPSGAWKMQSGQSMFSAAFRRPSAPDGLEHLVDMAGTLMPRHSARSTPSASIRKVLRSMPLTFLPYMILFLTTPNMWQSFSSVSAISSKGSSRFCFELVVRVHVVARHAEHHRAGLDEVLVAVAELHGLGGATRACRPSGRSTAPPPCQWKGLGVNFTPLVATLRIREGFVDRRHVKVQPIGTAGASHGLQSR